MSPTLEASSIPTTPPSDVSAEALRKTAYAHYANQRIWNVGTLKMTPEAAAAEEQFCRDLFESVLALPVDGRLQPSKWLQAHGYEKNGMAQVFAAIPYLKGPLQLLEMEFVHAKLGVLPTAQVEALLETRVPQHYQGEELNDANVFVRLRRK